MSCVQDNDDVVDALTTLLECDKSKDVRVAVVMELTLDGSTLPVLLQRARDVSPVVSSSTACNQVPGLAVPARRCCHVASVTSCVLSA